MIYNKSSIHMKEVENESIHCVITSPPYPMIKKWDGCFERQGGYSFWGMHINLLDIVWSECFRVLVDGGIMCINIGDATRTVNGSFVCWPNYAWVVHSCHRIGFNPLIPIFWKKISNRPNAFLGSGFLPVNAYVSQDHEYIGIFRKGKKLRKFSGEEFLRRKASAFNKAERDLWFQQVWNIQGKTGAKVSSSWPKEIPYRLMRMFSIIGDTILDPFCGLGEENLYKAHGRKFIGYEIG